jgi:hypothetical protein
MPQDLFGSLRRRKIMTNGVIVLLGNPSDGFTPYGPYSDYETAMSAWENEECWMMELYPDADTIDITDCDRPWCAHCKTEDK